MGVPLVLWCASGASPHSQYLAWPSFGRVSFRSSWFSYWARIFLVQLQVAENGDLGDRFVNPAVRCFICVHSPYMAILSDVLGITSLYSVWAALSALIVHRFPSLCILFLESCVFNSDLSDPPIHTPHNRLYHPPIQGGHHQASKRPHPVHGMPECHACWYAHQGFSSRIAGLHSAHFCSVLRCFVGFFDFFFPLEDFHNYSSLQAS